MAFDYVYDKGVAYAIGGTGESSAFGDILATGGKGGQAENGYRYYSGDIWIHSEAFRWSTRGTKWKTGFGE